MQIIDVLLDIERTPKKPQYTMATEMPLVLHSCEFEGLQFFTSEGKSPLDILSDSVSNSIPFPK